MVAVNHVTFEGRGHRALDAVSLRLAARRTFILGPNGAGKSVLLRVMHGLLRPTAGEVLWEPISKAMPGRMAAVAPHLPTARPPRLAMVFQRPVMLRRSVLGNVVYGMAVNRTAGMADANAAEALDRAAV